MSLKLEFSDGSGEGPPDDPSHIVKVEVLEKGKDKTWVSVTTIDEECSWFFNRENWEKFKAAVEKGLT